MSNSAVIRFAPSPNGELHLGHAYSALVAYGCARQLGARFLLRIEDIDIGRCRPEFEARILDDLAWIGLAWEEPVRRQSEHFDTYRKAIAKLQALGVLYPCFATRKEIAQWIAESPKAAHPLDPDGVALYPGLCRDLPNGEVAQRISQGAAYALRLDMARALELALSKSDGEITFNAFDPRGGVPEHRPANPSRWGDAVIARKDVPTSYHLAVVVDDALQGVTHVVRGVDLLAATDIHRLLQILLDLPEPLYHHHRLITDKNGRKLSKSHRDKSFASLRGMGAGPADIKSMVGFAP